MSTNNLPNGSSEGTIPVEEAVKRTENWRVYLESSKQDFNVRSYLIPIASYQNLLNNNPTAEAVRVYIGLADPTDPKTSQVFLVPIVDGHEQLFQGTQPGTVGGLGSSNVYDLTTPCPPGCDDNGGSGKTLDG
jgi:hypothetical protein